MHKIGVKKKEHIHPQCSQCLCNMFHFRSALKTNWTCGFACLPLLHSGTRPSGTESRPFHLCTPSAWHGALNKNLSFNE